MSAILDDYEVWIDFQRVCWRRICIEKNFYNFELFLFDWEGRLDG